MTESAERRCVFRVEGRVQGVGFRWWVQRTGRELGLRGAVRNLPDGAVEVRAAGPAEQVGRLEELLAVGPPAARVERVQVMAEDADVPESGFQIRF